MNTQANIAVVGAGPAGIEAAYTLAAQGRQVDLYEEATDVLLHLRDKACLFPNFEEADNIIDLLRQKLTHPNIRLRTSCTVSGITPGEQACTLTTAGGETTDYEQVLLTTGYSPFDAQRKEELGYGIYKGVITSLDLERMLREGRITNSMNERPRRITFLQCVGSRDVKIGNNYCSKVCCITAAKQAVEVRRLLPDAEIYVFYMDLRMWGQGFEELYRLSQERDDIRYIRGRISEAAGTFDGRVQIKAEDTLTGLPLKMSIDLLVLMVGMEASRGTQALGRSCNICGDYGFMQSAGPHMNDNLTAHRRVFVAGTCKRPMSINDTINDARSAALSMLQAN